jgi:putative membrane protein
VIANLLRGFLIGIAEVIPGVSGGTIALIVGIYERIIGSAASAVEALVFLVRGRPQEATASAKQIDWLLVLPVLTGMLVAIFAAAAAIEPLLESQPENMRGLFAGLILVSLIVPYRMVGASWRAADYLVGLMAAAISFVLVSLPRQELTDPSLVLVFLAAATAVCALVLPGVSGSFLLLAIGFYAPTIAAVNDLDFGYLSVFVLGAIVGLALFSTALRWLLVNLRRITLVVMTGLMLGSLRALWPWQDTIGQLGSPESPTPLVFFAAGAMVVALLLWVQSRASKAQ